MYQLTASPAAVRKGQMFIPADPLNRDYAEYLDWLAAGSKSTRTDECRARPTVRLRIGDPSMIARTA